MTETFLHGVEVIEIDAGPRPIRTVRSAVIGIIGTAPTGPVNMPVLIAGNRLEAVAAFGDDHAFSLPLHLDAIFDQIGAMVVAINVLDPSVHKTAVPAADYPVTAGVLSLPNRHVRNVVVKTAGGAGAALIENTDYTLDADAGTIAVLAGGALAAAVQANVAFDFLDPSQVDESDVMGGVDAGTGAYTGGFAFLAAESVVKVVPKILCAPGFTHTRPEVNGTPAANPVVAELIGIAERLRAVIIADGPNSTDAAAITWREDFGSRRVFVVDPWTLVFNRETDAYEAKPSSARVAGLLAKVDQERGFWWSPSNQEINGIGGVARPIDFALGDPNSRANLLNENEVATIIQADGFRLWGNRTCSSDPKWAFLSVVRTADMINESLLRAHLWAVDRNITKTYVDDVIEGVRDYLRNLTVKGAILGGDCWADPALNTPDQVAQGRIYFDFDFTPPYPAERITFRSHLVNDYISDIFAGRR